MAVKLPEGFVLDQSTSQNNAPNLPQGFVLDQPSGNVENPVNIRIPGPAPLSQNIPVQFGRGAQDAVESIPHGTQVEGLIQKTSPLINLLKLIPLIKQMGQQYSQDVQNAPPAQGILPNISRFAGNATAYSGAAAPFIAGSEALPAIPAVSGIASKLPGLARLVETANSPLGRTALGIGGFEGTKKVVEGKPLEAPGAFAAGTGLTYAGGKALQGAGKLASKIPEIPGNIKNYFSNPARIARYGKALKLSEPVIAGVQKYGIEPLMKFSKTLGDTSKEAFDSISQRVQSAFDNKLTQAEQAYQAAMKNVPIGYKDKIDIGPVRNKLIQVVRKYGALAKSDPQGSRLSNLLQSLNEMTSADAKAPITPGVRKQINITGKSKIQLSKEVLINKAQFQKFRDVLNGLYKESSGDVDVHSLIDSLYKAGEKAGLQGLGKARGLFRSVKQAEQLFPKGLYSETKLSKMAGTLPEADLRKLKSLERYLGIPFVEDANKVALSKHAESISSEIAKRVEILKRAGIGLAIEEATTGFGRKTIKKLTGL